MRVTINQPQFFQRLHMLNRIDRCDVAVILHSAQFVRRGDQPKLFIKSANGLQTMKVPTRHGGRKLIKDTLIDYGQRWQKKMLRSIEMSYRKAPLFKSFFDDVKKIINENNDSIGRLNAITIQYGIKCLKIETQILYDDELNIKYGSDPSEWMLNICKRIGATEYYCGGVAAKKYLNFDRFKEEGIKVTTQNWECEKYSQLYGEFIPNLSFIDMFMNIGCGKDARKLIGV